MLYINEENILMNYDEIRSAILYYEVFMFDSDLEDEILWGLDKEEYIAGLTALKYLINEDVFGGEEVLDIKESRDTGEPFLVLLDDNYKDTCANLINEYLLEDVYFSNAEDNFED